MAAHFGEMLREQRRRHGLSIQQVANTIKIRPQIIEYFETENFAAMPPRGYAQGMISSYARYLGLNPRDVVNAYFDQLYVFERSDEAASIPYQEATPFVSRRSSSAAGRFMVVDGPSGSSRYGQRPPQAGYVSDTTTGHTSLRVGSNARRRQALPAGGQSYGPYRGESMDDPAVTAQMRPLGQGSQSGRRPRPSGGQPSRVRSAGNDPRRGSTGRPARGQGVQRQAYRGRGAQGQRGRSASSRGRGGYSGTSGLFSDPRAFIAMAGVIVLLLVVIVVMAFRGCTSSSQQSADTATQTTAVKKSSSKSSSTSSDSGSSSDTTQDSGNSSDSTSGGTASADGSTTGDDTAADTAETHTVKISLAKGKTSWIEVKVDGVSQYADTAIGPYEVDYTPTKSIEITVDNPSDVSVTDNGSKVSWDSKSSGVGRVTITVPQPATISTDGSATDDSTGDASTDSSSSTDSSGASQ